MQSTPWLKLKSESASSYALFVRYRDAGSKRSLEMLATGVDLPDSDVSECRPNVAPKAEFPKLSALKALSRRHHWKDRADAWDQHLAAIRDQVIEANARKRAERELTRSDELFESFQKMRGKAMLALDFPLAEATVLDADGHPTKVFKPMRWGMKDIPALMRAAFDLRDEATNHQPNQLPAAGDPQRNQLVWEVNEVRRPLFVEVEQISRDDGPPIAPPIPEPPADLPAIEPVPEPSPPIPVPVVAKPDHRAIPPGPARTSFEPMLDELAKRKP